MKAAPENLGLGIWPNHGSELIFTQDRFGRYLSFSWSGADDYGVNPEMIVGRELGEVLVPINEEAYLERIQRSIDRRVPESYHCLFKHKEQIIPLELVISPILPKQGPVQAVLVMARTLDEESILEKMGSNPILEPDNGSDLVGQIARSIRRHPYQNLLTQIGRDIRRTLDLETIWQQTVDSLGQGLKVTRCLILSYNPLDRKVKVEAEYCQKPFKPLLGERFNLDHDTYWQEALSTSEPLAIDQASGQAEEKSLLAVSTFYQNQRNALICLQQCDRYRQWNLAEIELLREIAATVSTASAHATLYKELEQATERAEEASRLKSEFLASTSHELRTPLNGIIGFLKLIMDGMAEDQEEQLEFIQEAHKSAIHLLNLINDILDIAKIEAGKMELDFNDYPLDKLFDDVEKKTRPLAQQKGLNLDIQMPATREPIRFYGNYQRLLQILLNLVGNAIKFTDEGGVTISTELLKKKVKINGQELPGTVQIRVADTGIGVSLENQNKLFNQFSMVDGSRTRKYGGTGLGLSISKRLVEAMGGEIDFFSMGEYLGSTVTFTVPLFQMPLLKKDRD